MSLTKKTPNMIFQNSQNGMIFFVTEDAQSSETDLALIFTIL